MRTPPQLKTGQNVTCRGASSAGPLPFRRRLGHAVARLAGWRIETTGLPDRCVIIGADHTSAADFIVGMLVLLATGEEIRWAAKDTLFFGPVGSILRCSAPCRSIVANAPTGWRAWPRTFQVLHKFQLAILPDGNARRRTDHWKTGFYHIADRQRPDHLRLCRL